MLINTLVYTSGERISIPVFFEKKSVPAGSISMIWSKGIEGVIITGAEFNTRLGTSVSKQNVNEYRMAWYSAEEWILSSEEPLLYLELDISALFNTEEYLPSSSLFPAVECIVSDKEGYIIETGPLIIPGLIIEGSPNDLINIYPNPFTEEVNISISLNETSVVNLYLLDLTGKTLEVLLESSLKEGKYQYNFNLSKYPAGIYLIRLDKGSVSNSYKLIKLIKNNNQD